MVRLKLLNPEKKRQSYIIIGKSLQAFCTRLKPSIEWIDNQVIVLTSNIKVMYKVIDFN